jgi:hypothetical protein
VVVRIAGSELHSDSVCLQRSMHCHMCPKLHDYWLDHESLNSVSLVSGFEEEGSTNLRGVIHAVGRHTGHGLQFVLLANFSRL